jgi:mannose-1-phosphate guanylyltransferase
LAKGIKALILAGGMGTRLQPYTFFVPKPMLPLADKPLLEYLVLWLKKNGVNEIVLSVSYLRRMIEDYFRDGKDWKLRIVYARSQSPLGISGQILAAKQFLPSTFYLLYGDSTFDFDLQPMLDLHKKTKAALTMGLMEYSERMRYGVIKREKSGRVIGWQEKPEIKGLINIGCYVAEPTLFDYIPKQKMLGFDAVVRDMIRSGERIQSYVFKGENFLDIGDEESYRRVYDLYLQKLGKIL